MSQLFVIIGGITIVLLAGFISLTMMFSIPINPPDNATEQVFFSLMKILVILTPIWCLICIVSYFTGWGLRDNARYLWIPLTLLPILIAFIAEYLANLLSA